MIYRLDVIFSITHSVRGIFAYIGRGISEEDTKLHTMSGTWKMGMADCFYVTLG